MSSYIFDIDKISGMFWGLVIGDALGACYEYDSSIKWTGLIPRNSKSLFSYGQVTDDTELTISLLDSIITYNLENNIKGYPLSYDSFYSINSYIDWYNSEPVEISSHCEYLFYFSLSIQPIFPLTSVLLNQKHLDFGDPDIWGR